VPIEEFPDGVQVLRSSLVDSLCTIFVSQAFYGLGVANCSETSA
jgi:hypothetical protein